MITQSVVGAIEPEMLLVESKRASRRNPSSMDAFDCCMRAMWHFSQQTRADQDEAANLARRAISLDPNHAQGHMVLARALNSRLWNGWSTDFGADREESHAAAVGAAALDERDPYSHYALSWTSLMRRLHEQALAESQRSIDLNPNFSLGFFVLGLVRLHIGHFVEALDALLRSLRLNPNDPQAGAFMSFVSLAYYFQENYDEALHYGQMAVRARGNYIAIRALLATLRQLGRVDEAKALLGQFNSRLPKEMRRHFEITTPYLHANHREHLLEGLRRAGVPNLG